MTTALAQMESPSARGMAMVLKEQTEIRSVVAEYIKQHMEKEVDFGIIPGTQNPTLLQPGAEKLAALFQCAPKYDVIRRVEEWDTGLFHYEFKCQLVRIETGTVVSEGVGSCNSYESRYRWRNAARKCPGCGKEAIIRGKPDFAPRGLSGYDEGGWLCWKKKDGCGATFVDNDPSIVDQAVGKVQNEDIASAVNTILKMAQKRALVGAAVPLARRYGFNYTQDVEDMPPEDPHQPPPKGKQAEKPPKEKPKENPPQQQEQQPQQQDTKLTKDELAILDELLGKSKAKIPAFCEFYKIAKVEDLPKSAYVPAIGQLRRKIEQMEAKAKEEADKAAAEKARKEAEEAAKAQKQPEAPQDTTADIPW